MTVVRRLIKRALARMGWTLSRTKTVEQLEQPWVDQELLASMSAADMEQIVGVHKESRSQLRQDLFVAWMLGFKRGGYFVEVGAADGITLSNTYMLEKALDWRGVLIEPARKWHATLGAGRTCRFDTRCAWSKSGAMLAFVEADAAELSTIRSFKDGDYHAHARKTGLEYEVETVTLTDLLRQHDGVPNPDYLSLDTEGSELEVLHGLDFARFRPKVITCEHNFTPQRQRIHDFLRGLSYRRVLSGFSQFDDWYVDTTAQDVRRTGPRTA